MIERIELRRVLPNVFATERTAPHIADSQVWLTDSLTFTRGNAYMVEAESGSGKSSLCAYIYGSRRDYQGHILFDGRDATTLTIDQWCTLRRGSLACLPQEMGLFEQLSVMDNILIKNRLTHRLSAAEITHMLQALEIDHKASEPAGRLSIGQQQRVAIVRALCQPFDFLLADEPVSHLDDRRARAAALLITAACKREGAALIATSVGNPLPLDYYTSVKL